jgi:hypothetical protein
VDVVVLVRTEPVRGFDGDISEFFYGKTLVAQLLMGKRFFRALGFTGGMRGQMRHCRLLGEQQDRRQQATENLLSELF